MTNIINLTPQNNVTPQIVTPAPVQQAPIPQAPAPVQQAPAPVQQAPVPQAQTPQQAPVAQMVPRTILVTPPPQAQPAPPQRMAPPPVSEDAPRPLRIMPQMMNPVVQPPQPPSPPKPPINTTAVSLDSLDLAALITSRVCHDVISPVGAIVNGLEVLDDDKDPSMQEFALDLIRKSAKSASARLQFCRLAFGAAGSVGSSIDTRDAANVAGNFINEGKISLDWMIPAAYLPKNRVKLLLNMLVIAQTAIPRGGKIKAALLNSAEDSGFLIEAKGMNARIPPHCEKLLAGIPHSDNGLIDAHSIQPYYTGLLARSANMKITIMIVEDTVLFRAE